MEDESIYRKALQLESQNRPQDAIDAIDAIAQCGGSLSARLWYTKGNCHQDLDQHELAIACYQEALDMDPFYADCWCNMGASHSMLGNIHSALHCLDQCLQIHPGCVNALIDKASILDDFCQCYQEALTCIEAAEQLKKDSLYVYYTKANILFHLNRYPEAIAYYDKAIPLQRDFYRVYNNKGLCLKRMEHYAEALHCFQTALECERNGEVLNNMGLAYHFLGMHEEAIQCFKECISIGENTMGCISAYKNLALFYPGRLFM